MMRIFLVLVAVSALLLVGCGDNGRTGKGATSVDRALANFDKFEPTNSYALFEVEGWAVRISNDYSNHPDKKKLILKEIRQQLKAINNAVPQSALSKLKSTKFWIEYHSRPEKVHRTTPHEIGLSSMNITRIRRAE